MPGSAALRRWALPISWGFHPTRRFHVHPHRDRGHARPRLALLARAGRPDGEALAVADVVDPAQLFPPDLPNGDGVVPTELVNADDPALAAWIERLLADDGHTTDRSGAPGITQAQLDAVDADVRAVLAWHEAQPEGDPAVLQAAWEAVQAVVDKVDFMNPAPYRGRGDSNPSCRGVGGSSAHGGEQRLLRQQRLSRLLERRPDGVQRRHRTFKRGHDNRTHRLIDPLPHRLRDSSKRLIGRHDPF